MPRSTTVCWSVVAQKRHAGTSGHLPAQRRIHSARGQKPLQVVDPLEAGPLVVLQGEAGASVGGVELLGAAAGIPLRLELGQQATDLAEIHAVTPRVRSTVLRIVDARAGDDFANDLGQLTDPIVFRALADVERLTVNGLAGGGQHGEEGTGDVFNVTGGPPGPAVDLDVHPTRR